MHQERNLKLEGFAALRGWQKTGVKPPQREINKEVYGVYAPKFSKSRGNETVKEFYGKRRTLFARIFLEARHGWRLTQIKGEAPYPHEVYAVVYGGYTYSDVFYQNYSVVQPKNQHNAGAIHN